MQRSSCCVDVTAISDPFPDTRFTNCSRTRPLVATTRSMTMTSSATMVPRHFVPSRTVRASHGTASGTLMGTTSVFAGSKTTRTCAAPSSRTTAAITGRYSSVQMGTGALSLPTTVSSTVIRAICSLHVAGCSPETGRNYLILEYLT